jgi:hypothetical protein
LSNPPIPQLQLLLLLLQLFLLLLLQLLLLLLLLLLRPLLLPLQSNSHAITKKTYKDSTAAQQLLLPLVCWVQCHHLNHVVA